MVTQGCARINALLTQKAWNVYGINLISRRVGTDTLTYMYNGHPDVTALLDTNDNLVATYYYDVLEIYWKRSQGATAFFSEELKL